MPGEKTATYVRPSPAEMEVRRAAIRELFGKGHSTGEVATILGIPRRAVYRVVYADRTVRPSRAVTFRKARSHTKVPLGNLGMVIERQPENFHRWVLKSLPEGVSVAEFIVSCAVDAFHEETCP